MSKLLNSITFTDQHDTNPAIYFNSIKRRVYDFIDGNEKPLKFKLIFYIKFTSPDSEQKDIFHHSPLEIIRAINDFDESYKSVEDEFSAFIDQFQERGSGFVFNSITQVELRTYRMRGFRGSSYIPTPFKSSNIVNIQNKTDNKCFLWSILAKLYPADHHVTRVAKYAPYENVLNMTGINYPVTKHDIVKFECQNPEYSIYVWYINNPKDKFSLRPMYSSQYENRTIIDLLYLEDGQNTHYCLIKDLNSYLYSDSKHKGFVCRNCLHVSNSEIALANHQERCMSNGACVTLMPKDNILQFKNHHYKSRLPVAIYVDFEALNKKIHTVQPDPTNSYTNKIFKQEPISYGMYIKSDYRNLIKSEYHSYVGEDVIKVFTEELMGAYEEVSKKLNYFKKSKHKLTKMQEIEFQQATHCYMCHGEFDEKIREHNHLNGEFRGAACKSCNTKEGRDTKTIPVFIHNGSNYDFHFLVQEIVKYADQYNKVEVLAKTKEQYISISIGNRNRKLVFLDSYRFLGASLDNVSKGLTEDDFKIMKEHFEDIRLLKYKDSFKGFFPYEYLDSMDRFQETTLPPFEKWFSTLKDEGISEEQQQHVMKIWNTFNCKTFKDYHDIYLKMDVLILADAMETFREFFLKNHNIDPAYCYSAPGLTWQCGLKYTGVKLELLTDKDMLYMFEAQKRGGFSGVLGKRHVKANNKYLKDHDANKKSNYLLYLDANNLYGWAMSKKLPMGDFKWEEDPDYYKHIPEGRGCIVECDLKYTTRAQINTRKLPLAPEKTKIKEENLSELQLKYLEIENKTVGKTDKLLLNLFDKKKYVLHYKLLKYYESLGLKVTTVYRTISFTEGKWLKPYIDFNTEQRIKAKSNFEKDLWKGLNNAFYGKTCENIRDRMEVKLCKTEEEVEKYINKPSFKEADKLQDSLYCVSNNITSVVFNKPIYTGMCVLDYSKLLMYKFYYENINMLWPDNEVIGFDTDSYFLNINTDDVYEDMKLIKDELDTSDYPKTHFLQSNRNKKIIGKFKDELNGEIMSEIVFLRSKAYSYLVNGVEKKRLKGISRNVVHKHISFQDYKNVLFNDYHKINYNKMYSLNSENHDIFMKEINKKSISPYDDKRYILKDGIKTLPHCNTFENLLFEMIEEVCA